MQFLTQALERIAEWLSLGGPVVALLLTMSVLALAIALLKAVQFWRLGRPAQDFVPRLARDLRQHGAGHAAGNAAQRGGAAAKVVSGALAALARGEDVALVREDAERVATAKIADMQFGIRWLELIAQMAPLLGLFGTVLGMIDAFRALQSAGSQVDPSILAGGIWTALLTTAVGLAVAMPVSVAVAAFESYVQNQIHTMEQALTIVFTAGVSETGAADQREHRPVAPLSQSNAV